MRTSLVILLPGLIVAAPALVLHASGAHAAPYNESVLFGFCDQCKDGYEPRSWVYQDAAGDLFGTTFGGSVKDGTVFELQYDESSKTYTHVVVHGFCTETKCSDGAAPYSGLIAAGEERLFGTTSAGGAFGGGTIYELSYDAIHDDWNYRVVYDFCAKADCADGETPYAGLTADPQGNLYGTTYNGGANGYGTVFELTFTAANETRLSTLFSFDCTSESCPDGGNPSEGLYIDAAGNLFGTSAFGANSAGTVFELSYDDSTKSWVHTDIYDFCESTGCPDGGSPSSRLVADASGNLYGTTFVGGTKDQGAVYRLSPGGKGWNESVIYSFCTSENCPNGQSPSGALWLDDNGDIYGTTYAGGANNSGIVYRLGGGASSRKVAFSILYSFCSQADCADGSVPTSGVIADESGNFYGTTESGALGGTVFELSHTHRARTLR
ncbi:MAG TPA: choice-of-anchor tandem repeat GloVer-containing protein [Rhizomicrobium sp.]|jgi:uncharacterized repeat protein (TIGR03803 family)